ncbi:MAG: glycosyltransferase [Pseudomonadales bacterium]|nr:glycosyltransferase [Pseudomonadales bacterium]
MIFLVHAHFTESEIASELGKADYSYFFVLRAYVPVLETLGKVVELRDPEHEADEWYERCAARGEYCVLLSFSPPHRVPNCQRCPVMPVFAWEYERIPDESWRHDRETDWSRILARLGSAITHSEFAAEAVRRAIRQGFPVVSVPAPVWDAYSALAHADLETEPGAVRTVSVTGTVLDSRCTDMSVDDAQLLRDELAREQQLLLDGVVYTTVFCPLDGRKNWEDIITSFCWAFADSADCTLLLKLVHHDRDEAISEVLTAMRRLPPCAARIVIVHAYLDSDQYRQLILASDFVVNASLGEGQCLPLMEFMSAGVPAIAPRHTAMLDYLDADCGFVVESFRELCNWPHDMRLMNRTMRYRPQWESLRQAFIASHATRLTDAPGYRRMTRCATERLRQHCSQSVARSCLEDFFLAHATLSSLPGHGHGASAARELQPTIAGTREMT